MASVFRLVSRMCMVAALLCSVIATGCGNEEPFQLRVSLFPWVPEPGSLFNWIERDFEEKHPDIDLVVRPLEKSYDWEEQSYVGDLAYEIDKTVAALRDRGPDRQHLVEVDAMILGALIDSQAVAPFGLSEPRFLAAASEAATWHGVQYGVPHWTCGFFVISEDASVTQAANLPELLATLDASATERVNVVGDLDGSWDAIMAYLDAIRDTDSAADLRTALREDDLRPQIAELFRALGKACTKDGLSRCGQDSVELFSTGHADALIGYSERLHPILSDTNRTVGELHIASAPLGYGDHPTLFVDVLVLSPQCASERCLDAARRFARYFVSDAVFEVVLLSLDKGTGAAPRYLLPSTSTAFGYGRVRLDRLYQQLADEINGARPYPNSGVPEAIDRGRIRDLVMSLLGLAQ